MAQGDAIVLSKCLIGGRWGDGEGMFPIANPYTRATIAHAALPSRAQVQQAVRLASEASAKAPAAHDRARILIKARDLLAERRRIFAETMMAEGGFASTDIEPEIDRALITMELCAEEAKRIAGEMIPLDGTPGQERRIAFTLRRPVGVVCAITPFNAPLNAVLHKVAPALAGGNAVILKPSPRTPLTAALLCQLLLDAGLPPDLLTLLNGDAEVATWLLEEKAIDFYSFTGSTRVGRIIQAGAGLRRTHLELGSIACTIICADADIEAALPKVVNASFRRAGQFCTSTQRLYVEDAAVEAVRDRLVQAASALQAGDPRDPKTRVCPMISEQEAIRAKQWVDEACAAQARVLTGGERRGAVLQPTVLTEVRKGSKVIDQEIFAPVVSIMPFRDLDETIAEINGLPYGLASGIFTHRLDRGFTAATALRMGSVHINDVPNSRTDSMPYGGVKDSGFGREGPRYAIQEMTEERVITVRY
jgi:succinate-semialdehyde dehydrogenase/glutarate-semialdehyde dehydrogenase